MHSRIAAVLAGSAFSLIAAASSAAAATLAPVYASANFQPTGVTAARGGRLFVNFPRWSDRYRYAVVEVDSGGVAHPYPDAEWNLWDGQAATTARHFICVQSVIATKDDALWVLDAGAPNLGPVVEDSAKLVRIDLATNKVTQFIPFGPDVVGRNSYLNDVRFDLDRNVAYITDSGMGGILVVDLESGIAHRALDGHPSVMADPKVRIVIDGAPVLKNGKTPRLNSDAIALSPDGAYLYYQALTGKTLYRVPTAVLRDAGASPAELAKAVERVAETFPVDGIWMNGRGELFLTDLTHNAIVKRAPDGATSVVVTDPLLQWPDTLTEAPDGAMYVTASYIHQSPMFNDGVGVRTHPYGVYKFTP